MYRFLAGEPGDVLEALVDLEDRAVVDPASTTA
jgi:hypothetical protein